MCVASVDMTVNIQAGETSDMLVTRGYHCHSALVSFTAPRTVRAAVSWGRGRQSVRYQPVVAMSTKSSSTDLTAMYYKGRDVLSKFTTGMKSLFADGKQAYYTYKRLSNGTLVTVEEAKATAAPGKEKSETIAFTMDLRRDYLHMRETVQAFAKLFPLILLWIPPGLGFVPALFFVYFPRQMFTRQFWTDADKDEFPRIHYQMRSAEFAGLCEKLGHKLDVKGGDAASLLEEVLNAAEKFGEGRELSLASLPSEHIKSLAKAAQLYEVPWLVDVLPAPYLRWALGDKASELLVDDLMLRAAGCGQLMPQELRHACDMRGLPALGVAQDAALRSQLQAYLDTYDRIATPAQQGKEGQGFDFWWPGQGGTKEAVATLLRAASQNHEPSRKDSAKPVGKGQRLPPPSLLLHLPALLKSEHPQQAKPEASKQ